MYKKKVRIVERTSVDGKKRWIIQQKHFLFCWWWVDAWMNSMCSYSDSSYPSLEVANNNLCYFDGTKRIDKVVLEIK